ncbi:response regulator transcription factor [[Clostridium] colinum]|uniref:response regulator transcription factor n=1 Tax=[Clostridium] colinum TaxID=36835 RepID=UPI00202510CF|nr:response regulator [[Clostridium] colinum]
MYKVIIIDAEEDARNNLIKKINWEKYNFQILDIAENGKEALEKIEKLKPDLIFTDIKMSFLTGIELIKILCKNRYNTKIVIVSKFTNFEYIKDAINNNVIGYILKPINIKEIEDILIKAKNNFDIEYNQKRDFEALKKYYTESLPIIKTQFFSKAIEGKLTLDYWQNKCKILNIKLDNKYFLVATIKYSLKNIEKSYFEDEELILFSIKNILDESIEQFNKSINFYSFFYLDSIVTIFNIKHKSEIKHLIKELNNICEIYYKIMKINISIGLGYCVEKIQNLKVSYESSEEALLYKIIMGNRKTIYINDIEPDKNIKLVFSENDEKKLYSLIKLSEEEEIKKFVEEIFYNINKIIINSSDYNLYFIEIILSILKLSKNYNISTEKLFGKNFEINKIINEIYSIDNLKEYFLEKFIILSNLIKNQRINYTNNIVERAKIYIDENYDNPELSINSICDVLFISPTYFSAIFKKTLNISFIKYLTNLRLEKALELINTTSEKTSVIAKKVGYTDANYFSYVFKKKYGLSPLKYKNNK